MTPAPAPSSRDLGEVLGRFLQGAHQVPPDRLTDLVEMAAAQLGASSCRVWLVDHQQRSLVAMGTDVTDGERPRMTIDTSLGGRAFVSSDLVETSDADPAHLWYPLLDGVDRIGVLELEVPGADDGHRASFRRLASVAAAEIITRGQYTDHFTVARRTKEMSLPAELQWQGLPPMSFTTADVAAAGMLEPAYDVGGDTFDYAHNVGCLEFLVLDAVGHALEASSIASLAQGAYRHQRRAGRSLGEVADTIDQVVRSQFGRGAFATGQVGRLDTETGALTYLSAGHADPILIRGSHVEELASERRLPFGWNHLKPDAPWIFSEHQLEPRDAVLFFTDGVTEARQPDGEQFGLDRLKDFLHTATAAALSPVETLRRLSNAIVDFHDGSLADDATMFLVSWRPEHAG